LLYLAAVRGELVMEVSRYSNPVPAGGSPWGRYRRLRLALTARQRQQRPHAGEPWKGAPLHIMICHHPEHAE
jgi:hypothetical protein